MNIDSLQFPDTQDFLFGTLLVYKNALRANFWYNLAIVIDARVEFVTICWLTQIPSVRVHNIDYVRENFKLLVHGSELLRCVESEHA